MADLVLEPTQDGGQFVFLANGDFKITDALYNAGYLALLSNPFWGNDVSQPNSRIVSRLNDLFNENLTSSIRNKAVRYANQALAFFVETGIADEISIEAIIQSSYILILQVRINQPDGTILDFSYGLNWKAQSIEIPFKGVS